jgi:hypothetical protein
MSSAPLPPVTRSQATSGSMKVTRIGPRPGPGDFLDRDVDLAAGLSRNPSWRRQDVMVSAFIVDQRLTLNPDLMRRM